ncbi:catechol 2,3-dioxygenase [Alicyclobacillus hesperidum URH17-3-68]|uniref:Catechol 2,3-dioxygenase n=1 Tax=Alicyclobacillus hesperidum TaxID=89784 RepID=A0A1H2ST26_9BACL|nr:catechol 2,3-dioxygenase [Alicyclobacillus hesperidum]EJY55087.1 catechol 2,3-dioxygenase [Alicyclobacillus hesperidum URH17-3-68]GLV12542.1 catechol 2,3-dioxygenase [Alicyclobacillus hesperidum]SDW34738.1 catechol 2,3-dioxygenase [Alicyclobacillus hesperidum]
MSNDLCFDIAHVGHVELLTPKPDESLWFFRELLGMEEVARQGQSVYLRCFGDYERYSIKLTESGHAGVGHTALRAASEAALERRVEAVTMAGCEGRWHEGDIGHGRAYAFHGPDGHLMELYYETEHYQPSADLRPTLKNQPQKFTGRGVGVKTMDHVNYLSSHAEADGDFVEKYLGLRLTEQIQLNNGRRPGVWYRCSNKSYDLVYTQDATGARGRLHHIAFRVDTNEAIWRAADLFVDAGVFIEFAPSKHAINQTYFVYVYEPGGNRIEICSGGYLVLAPDWQPITWTEEERARGQAWGNKTVESFHHYGTPVV